MRIQDKGYLLSLNKYNENSAIVEFFTENYGKISGIIFGANSKKIKNYLLIGNKFYINYFILGTNNSPKQVGEEVPVVSGKVEGKFLNFLTARYAIRFASIIEPFKPISSII